MMNNEEGEEEEAKLFRELTDFEKKGVGIRLDGWPASPLQVVQAHTMREDTVFMRDYEINDRGDIEKLCFTSVNIKKK